MASNTSGNEGRRGPAGLQTKLSGAWLAAVIGAAIWARLTGQGPFAWLETWYAVTTGNLLGANVLFAILIFTLPAVIVLMGAMDRADKSARSPTARRRQLSWVAGSLFALAGMFLVVAIVAGLLAARAPDGSEAAVAVSPEQLAGGNAPVGRRVAIVGATDLDVSASFEEAQKNSSTTWVYAGFRPGATRKDMDSRTRAGRPFALFLEGSRSGAPGRRLMPAQETVEGYLVENGLPAYARIVLERQGVRIATPHYLLRDGESGLAGDYFVPLALGIFFAFIFGLIGAIVLIVHGVQHAAARE